MKSLSEFINESLCSIINENIVLSSDINECFGYKHPVYDIYFEDYDVQKIDFDDYEQSRQRRVKAISPLTGETLEFPSVADGDKSYVNASKLLSIRKDYKDTLKNLPVYKPGRNKNPYTLLGGYYKEYTGLVTLMILSENDTDFENNLNQFTKPGVTINIQKIENSKKYGSEMIGYRIYANDVYLCTPLFKA
jgi:hypothetical protein